MKKLTIIVFIFLEILYAKVTIPNDFKKVVSDIGVDVYSYRGKPIEERGYTRYIKDYQGQITVQIVDLKSGAQVNFSLNKLENEDYSTSNIEKKEFGFLTVDKFYKQTRDKNLFSVTNSGEFSSYYINSTDCTNILWRIKNRGKCHLSTKLTDSIYIESQYFLGDNNLNHIRGATPRILYINNRLGIAKIKEISLESLKKSSKLKNYIEKKYPNMIVGKYLDLDPEMWIKDKGRDARTAIGVIDEDDDGNGDTIIVLVATQLKNNEVGQILKRFGVMGNIESDGKCYKNKIQNIEDKFCSKMSMMLFDSGSSSQLYTDNKYVTKPIEIKSDKMRPIPSVVSIYKGVSTFLEKNDLCHKYNLIPMRIGDSFILGKNNRFWQKCKNPNDNQVSLVFKKEEKAFHVESGFSSIFLALGGITQFGYPIMEEASVTMGKCQSFEKGMITWEFTTGNYNHEFNTKKTCADYITENGCFLDVDNKTTYTKEICSLKKEKIMNGRRNGKFAPTDFVIRQDILKVLLLAKYSYKEIEQYASKNPKFLDITKNMWCNKYANFALKLGIFSKRERFLPYKKVSLIEASKMIIKTFGLKVRIKNTNEDWYIPYIEKLKEKNIKVDKKNYSEPITRGYLAYMISILKRGKLK